MYVVTFYSYKGGVGRTQALFNCAVQLAKSGKSVLAVDFDLEAPGLDAFKLGDHGSNRLVDQPGLVEFVSGYLDSGRVPDVRDYVYEFEGLSENGGALRVMPAACVDDTYAARLHRIDWNDLYQRRDGFVLFEDLKAQWEKAFRPDYVLLDSRTGLTDVGGICTRQLPDAVVLMAMPNEENRRGIVDVARQVRLERRTGLRKQIKLHAVLSNVPFIDDEDGILKQFERRLRRELVGVASFSRIHRYESLALLENAVFTLNRVRSRLAREYLKLVRAIQIENEQDEDGALDFLRRIAPRSRGPRPADSVDRIGAIVAAQSSNGRVLAEAGRARLLQGKFDESVSLLERAEEMGHRVPSMYLDLAIALDVQGKDAEAVEAARQVFSLPEARLDDVLSAIQVLRRRDPTSLVGVSRSPALSAWDASSLVELAGELRESRAELVECVALLLTASQRVQSVSDLDADASGAVPGPRSLERGPEAIGKTPALKPSDFFLGYRIAEELTLAYIGLGRYQEAIALIPPEKERSIAQLFNFAMLRWGMVGSPDPVPFVEVIARKSEIQRYSPNSYQCLAVASWAVGRLAEAEKYLQAAERSIVDSDVSCWRYLRVSATEFMEDLREIRRLVQGERLTPRYMRES